MVDKGNVGLERWGNITNTGLLKNSESTLPHCHILKHKSHINWRRIETVPPWLHAGDWRSEFCLRSKALEEWWYFMPIYTASYVKIRESFSITVLSL